MNQLAVAAIAAAFAVPVLAQAPASPPPAWQQGKPSSMQESTLHPFAPHMTGRSAKELPVNTLKVPAGFKVEVWAEGIPEARSLALGDNGTVFVSNRISKNVYAVVDSGGKREVKQVLKGLNAPNGLTFSKGTLYVAERDKITAFEGIETKLDNPGEGKVVADGLDPDKQPATSGSISPWARTASSTSTTARRRTSPCPPTSRRRSCASIRRPAWSRTSPRACGTRSASTGIRRRSISGSPSTGATGWATTCPRTN